MFTGNNFNTAVCVLYIKKEAGSVGDGHTKLRTPDTVVGALCPRCGCVWAKSLRSSLTYWEIHLLTLLQLLSLASLCPKIEYREK